MSWVISPRERDPYLSNVSLLLHGNGTNGSTAITDSGPSPKLLTLVGDVQISTAQSKFGGSSIVFDKVDDRITASSADFAFGTGDFTIETWLNVRSTGPERGFLQTSDTSGGLKSSYSTGVVCFFGTPNRVSVYIANVGHNTPSNSFDLNSWFHFAVCRQSGTASIYVNGISLLSAASPGNCVGQNLVVGGYYDTNYLYDGFIDELRITKGIARYNGNFIPAKSPFPDI